MTDQPSATTPSLFVGDALTDVIRRYAEARPGLTLVHAERAALPIYWLRLDVLAQQRKDLPPVDEFVLRAVQAGAQTISEVAGILGLAEAVIRPTVASLVDGDSLDYAGIAGEPSRLRLTLVGEKVLAEQATVRPHRIDLGVAFDRLTWTLAPLREAELLSPREVRDQKLLELPAVRQRRVEADELDLSALNRLLTESPSYRPLADVQVLTLRDVTRRQRRYLPVDLLVYAGGDEVQATVAIDGRPSPKHEQALSLHGGLAAIGVAVDLSPSAISDAERDAVESLPSEIRDARLSLDDVHDLQRQAAKRSSRLEVGDSAGQADATPGNELELDQLEGQLSAQSVLDAAPVRSLATHEHRGQLLEALATAQDRLLLTSPWINAGANDEFFDRLESLLRRKPRVRAHIAYGIGDPARDRSTKQDLVDRLTRLAERYSHLTFKRLRNSHAKVLIWDNTWITTSFNWMSFLADPTRTYRMEFGTLVRLPDYVELEYRRWVALIEKDPGPREAST